MKVKYKKWKWNIESEIQEVKVIDRVRQISGMGKQVPWLTSPTSLADSETQINGRKVTKNINKHKHKNSRQNKRCLDYQINLSQWFISPYSHALSLSTQQRRNSSKVKVKLDSKVGCQLMAQCSCPILADVLLEVETREHQKQKLYSSSTVQLGNKEEVVV